jgi:hypothetical protein
MPTSTYTPIATTTLGSSQSSVTFNSFSGYTDLILIGNAIRGGTPGSGAANYNLTFNGDTGSTYSSTLLYEGSPYSDRQTNTTSMGYSGSVGDNNRMQNTLHIMNYSNTTTYKTILARWGSPVDGHVRASVGLWRSTAAITSFTITPSLGVAAGSSFTLYGIKAA